MRLPNFENLSFLKKYIGIVITVVSLYFIFSIIFSSKTKILPVLSSINYLPLVLGIVLIGCFFLIRGYVWTKILKKLNYDVDTGESIYLLSVSEIKRYIPGGITAVIARMYAYKKHKVPKKIILKAYLIESILFIFSTAIISISAIIFILQRVSLFKSEYIGVSFSALSFLLLILFILFRKMKLYKALFKYSDHFLILLFGWLLFGLGNFLVLISIASVNPYIFIPLVSLFVFSWLVGFITVFAPSGIGIREAVLVFGLSLILPFETAVLVAALTRLALISGDLLALLSVFAFNKTKKKYKKLRQISFAALLVGSFFISYIIYFSYTTFGKYLNFFTGRFDLGNMDQTVWNTLNGRLFQLTDPNGVNTISRLSIHADFILILLFPFYYVWNDPRMLLLIQTVVLSFGGIFVYLFAVNITKNKFLATALSVSYFINPFVHRQNLYDFHAVTLATTLLLAAFYFLEKKKMFWFSLFTVLAVLCKENIFLVASIFGFYVFAKYKKKTAILFGVASIVMFYLLVSKIIPWYRGSAHFALAYYQELGDSPLSIIENLLLSPQKLFLNTVSYSNVIYLFRLFLPTGFLALLSPIYLIFAIPDLAINILSKNENLKSILFQYNATIIPFIYIATAFTAKKLVKFKFLNYKKIGIYLITFALVSTYFYGVLPGTAHPSLEIFSDPNRESKEIFSVLKTIPQDAKVASTNNLGAQLSHRQYLYTIPMGIEKAQYLLFLLDDPYAQPSPQEQRKIVNELLSSQKYSEIYNKNNFIVIKRI